MIPVADPDAVDQLEEILDLNLADDMRSRGRWHPTGAWHRIPTVVGVATQEALEAAALERSSFLDDSRRARTLALTVYPDPGHQ